MLCLKVSNRLKIKHNKGIYELQRQEGTYQKKRKKNIIIIFHIIIIKKKAFAFKSEPYLYGILLLLTINNKVILGKK